MTAHTPAPSARRRLLTLLWRAVTAALAAGLLALLPSGRAVVWAQTADQGQSQSSYDADVQSILHETPFYDPNSRECAALPGSVTSGAGATDSGTPLPSSVPAVWKDLIDSVAPQYPDADRRLVATTLWVENRGWPDYNKQWAVSSASAQGPWQFIPSTWASMGTDGDGDGIADPNNPKDAVHAAFKHQLGSAGLPIATEGYTGTNADTDFQTTVFHRDGTNLLSFASKYNGSGAPDGTLLTNFPRGQNPDYVIMSYWLLATNFQKGFIFDNGGTFVDAASYGGLFSNQGPSATDDQNATATPHSCNSQGSSGNGLVSANGYSFPVAPQTKSGNSNVPGLSPLPCPAISSCHHDNTAAFDIGRQPGGDDVTGTPVYAFANGTIRNVHTSYQGIPGCPTYQLLADDGFWYWYGHTQNLIINEGETVRAGQQISVVGERKCTGNYSTPHLHIDRGCVQNGVPQPGGYVSCRDPGMFDLMNAVFNALPE